MSGKNPRQIALRVLQARRQSGEFTETLLERALAAGPSTVPEKGQGSTMSSPDRALCQELVYGVVRAQAALDWLIDRKTGGRRQNSGMQSVLRLGLYQVFWLDRIPAHAAVHETVELAKREGFGPKAGFVNAVLRGYLREFDATKKLLAELKETNPVVGILPSAMARGEMGETIWPGTHPATARMEQPSSKDLCPGEHSQDRGRKIARKMAR